MKNKFKYIIPSLLLIWFAFCLPSPLFHNPTSTIIEDKDGNLLNAKIASDEQWRFPKIDTLPEKFIKAITYFEDEYFYSHIGINPVSTLRAIKQNISAGKIVSGGSTITMQTIRLSRKGQKRTFFEKIIEVILAIRLEISNSKKEILKLYASNAPFGGNVVGLETASWRYFGRKPSQLSWGETCALAVLPNAPSLIYPGKNHEKLKKKRDRLLNKLFDNEIIDRETCELAKSENLPGTPYPIPRIAPHLMQRIINNGYKGQKVTSTLNIQLQNNVNRIVNSYYNVLKDNEIHNIACLVLDIKTGKVLAYTGNSSCTKNDSKDVDIITSPRSTGSILKPFLYAFMLQDGAILPKTLISDIPTQIAGYAPKNFNKTFEGVVPADKALAHSLNIPAVRELKEYGLELFYQNLKKLNFSTINKPANHYGLSIILGGAESTLWDLSNEYMKMAQTLNNSVINKRAVFIEKDYLNRENVKQVFNKGTLWWTLEALSTLNRPAQETGWQEFNSSQKVAWKTGTSFGHRDAWAIGITRKYVVGVWVGNADGEGRPGLTGVSSAAPIMFKVYNLLDKSKWFEKPTNDLVNVITCKQSGYIASDICPETIELDLPKKSVDTKVCPYHKIIHLDKNKQFRVTDKCYSVSNMKPVPWFILTPVQEWYYKRKNPYYKTLPAYKPGCNQESLNNMAVIYPKDFTKIFIPRNLEGKLEKTIFEVAHRNAEITIFWHLDEKYICNTKSSHKIEIRPSKGNHTITLIDENGETISWNFIVLEK